MMAAMKSNLSFVAYHEAGHVIATLRLGNRITKKGVSIMPDDSSNGRAHTKDTFRGRPDMERTPRIVRDLENSIICSMAGLEAQRKHNPRSIRSYHDESDRVGIALLLSYLSTEEKELKLYEALLRRRTQNILAIPWVWEKVEMVATELLKKKTLTKDEVMAIWVMMPSPAVRPISTANAR